KWGPARICALKGRDRNVGSRSDRIVATLQVADGEEAARSGGHRFRLRQELRRTKSLQPRLPAKHPPGPPATVMRTHHDPVGPRCTRPPATSWSHRDSHRPLSTERRAKAKSPPKGGDFEFQKRMLSSCVGVERSALSRLRPRRSSSPAPEQRDS